jgi:hypothetical protein
VLEVPEVAAVDEAAEVEEVDDEHAATDANTKAAELATEAAPSDLPPHSREGTRLSICGEVGCFIF